MNEHSQEGRSALEMAQFAVVSYGAVIGASGVVIDCLWLAMLGGGLAGLGLLSFGLNQWLSE